MRKTNNNLLNGGLFMKQKFEKNETLFCILLIIAKSSIEIWHLLSNDDVQKEYLYELIKSGRYSSEYFYLRWFSELSQAIENNDSSAQDIYI